MRLDDISQLKEAVRTPTNAGAGAFGQMANTLGGANKSKSSTGGTTTRTPTGVTHTANPSNPNNQQAQQSNPAQQNQQVKQPPTKSSADTTELTKDWIQFLKNNQIVGMKPDPKTGMVVYKKQPTTDNLTKFLLGTTNYDKETISNAIQSVMTPGAQPAQKRSGGKVAGVISQTPTAIRKRAARAANRQPPVTEAMMATATPIHEKDVEAIFSQLLSQGPSGATPSNAPAPAQTNNTPDNSPDDAGSKLKSIKKLIRNEMNPMQRKALWRALNESALTESEIQPADVNAIFKDAYKLRVDTNTGVKGALNTGLGKIHKGLRKDKIDINDLQQAWKDEGYPDDTRDIHQILKSQGFRDNEIDKIFSNVFGSDSNHETEVTSPAATKIASYADKNGLKDALIKFMQQEYGEELGITQDRGLVGKAVDFGKNMFSKKATTEEVRQIFSTIVNEERFNRDNLIKTQDLELLGRFRK